MSPAYAGLGENRGRRMRREVHMHPAVRLFKCAPLSVRGKDYRIDYVNDAVGSLDVGDNHLSLINKNISVLYAYADIRSLKGGG
jgi:hypothetical protein